LVSQTHEIKSDCAAVIETAGREGGRSVKRVISVTLLALALIAGGVATLVVGGVQSAAVAQDATADASLHPIVGAWLLTVDVSDETDPPHLVIYHADGTYVDAAAGRGGGVGVWEPIDEHTVAANILFHTEDEAGNVGLTRIRTESTVDEPGDAYRSEYTREVIAADGTSTGELGPGTGTAKRIVVEPKGEVVGAMSGAEGTPES
jgi:hypothetical protein